MLKQRIIILVSGLLLLTTGGPTALTLEDPTEPPETEVPGGTGPYAEELLSLDPKEIPDQVRTDMAPLADASASEAFEHLAALSGSPVSTSDPTPVAPPWIDEVPIPLQDPVVTLWTGLEASEEDAQTALADVDSALVDGFSTELTAALSAREAVADGTATAEDRENLDAFLDEVSVVDLDTLTAAHATLLRQTEEAIAGFHAADTSLVEQTQGTCVSGPVLFEAPECVLVIGANGANTYDQDIPVTVDMGGADTYRNNAGGTGAAFDTTAVAAAIDLGPEGDIYDTDADAGDAVQGGGFLGLGLLVDEGGDDSYTAAFTADGAGDRTWTQGTGALGVGTLWDQGGDDSYEARNIAQGAGLEGYGLHLEGGGSDTYLIPYTFDSEGGQGTGCFHTSFGALVDQGTGQDTYNASIDDMQGFSCLAAVGVLYDGGGSDDYILRDGLGELSGDTVVQSGWGQGYGELGAAALLVDEGGNDVYHSTGSDTHSGQQAQGVGIVGGVGVLVDDGGHDEYTARRSTQGFGGLGAVGVLADDAGDDIYRAEQACQGAGAASPGVLLDTGGGDDTYDCPEDPLVGQRGDGEVWTGGLGGLGIDR